MKKLFIVAILFFGLLSFSIPAEARSVRVKSYYKPSIGKYVMPYYRTSPNKYKFDNYSTKGNYNPYTGKKGYSSPYKTYRFR